MKLNIFKLSHADTSYYYLTMLRLMCSGGYQWLTEIEQTPESEIDISKVTIELPSYKKLVNIIKVGDSVTILPDITEYGYTPDTNKKFIYGAIGEVTNIKVPYVYKKAHLTDTFCTVDINFFDEVIRFGIGYENLILLSNCCLLPLNNRLKCLCGKKHNSE